MPLSIIGSLNGNKTLGRHIAIYSVSPSGGSFCELHAATMATKQSTVIVRQPLQSTV